MPREVDRANQLGSMIEPLQVISMTAQSLDAGKVEPTLYPVASCGRRSGVDSPDPSIEGHKNTIAI